MQHPTIEVPSNASRFMRSHYEALRQSTSEIRLAWDEKDPYLFNEAFDSSSIAHDEAYCTSVVDLDKVDQVPTTEYFFERVLPLATGEGRVVDIGCGQGEFVEVLRDCGVEAVGYDPVLRRKAAYLHDRYWTTGEGQADLFVMRCVLPHIPSPWEFLRALGDSNPGALVLIEFQCREWILDEGIWYQLSHDHVNVFSVSDFEARFRVVDRGIFAGGEWAWVVIRADSYRDPEAKTCPHDEQLERLFAVRAATLDVAVASTRPLAVWGAAGKGIVLAHALVSHGAQVLGAIDADPRRQGLFMEVSALPILAPGQVADRLPRDTLILVCNPNHLAAVSERYGDDFDLALPRDLARTARPGHEQGRATERS